MISKTGYDYLNSEYKNIQDIPVTTIEQKDFKRIGQLLDGKKLFLIVNLASLWGVTDQNYKELVQIHNDYKSKGLEVLGFPSNDFKQEPGSARQIIEFAR